MRALVQVVIPAASGIVDVECPEGNIVRMVAAQWTLSSGGDGDQAFILIARGTQNLLTVVSDPQPVSVTIATAAIGISNTGSYEQLIDPVTGAITHAQSAIVCMALPNIWWPFQFRVTFTMANGSLGAGDGTLSYEIEPARKDWTGRQQGVVSARPSPRKGRT